MVTKPTEKLYFNNICTYIRVGLYSLHIYVDCYINVGNLHPWNINTHGLY